MVAEPEFFVCDETGPTGPLSAICLRLELGERDLRTVKVRLAGSSTLLPPFAWEAAGDCGAPPAPPPLPPGGAGTMLPSDVAELTPKMRENLLWFVSDTDGLLGPVSGAFIRSGLTAGKLTPTAAICMVASREWVRAAIVFPRTIEGTTRIRSRPLLTAVCAFCGETMADGDGACDACGERALAAAPLDRRRGLRIVVGVYAALCGVFAAVLVAAKAPELGFLDRLARGAVRAERRSPGDAAASAAAPLGSTSAAETLRPTRSAASGGHLRGEVAATWDVAPDAVDALALPHQRVAVLRKAAVDVFDEASGALVFSAAELPALRALYPAGEAIYGLGVSRIAIIDAESFRTRKWIELGALPNAIAASGARGSGPLALAPLEMERAVAVLDTVRHAEVERFRFDERVTSVSIDDSTALAVGVTSDMRGPRPGEDAVLVFNPSRLAGSQPVHRVYVGGAPVAAAIAPSGGETVVALFGVDEIAQVTLTDVDKGAAPVVVRHKTCDEPMLLQFAPAAGLLIVGCRGARAVALHDATSFAKVARIDLGGPVMGIEVAPDGLQALVVSGAPMASVGVLDLAQRSFTRLPIKDEIASARYGRGGVTATALSLRAHRMWALR